MTTSIPRKRFSNTLANAIKKAGLTEENSNSVRRWLQEQLGAYEYAKLGQGGHTNTQVPLKRVFIDLPVGLSPHTEDSTARMPFLACLLGSKVVDLSSSMGGDLQFDAAEAAGDSKARSARGALRKAGWDGDTYGTTLLVGGPGQGKSTLGQLACQIHRAHLLEPASDKLNTAARELVESFFVDDTVADQPNVSWCRPSTVMLPLQVALPDLAVWLNLDGGRKLHPPAILRYISELDSAKACGLSAHVLAALAINIPILLFLDGFDEVGAAHDRERLVLAANELLSFLAHHRGKAQIIATTRPQGYSGEFAKIGVALTTRFLLPLEKEEALKYAEKLVFEKIQGADDRKQTLDRLREAADESSTERLLITPLQVTILTALVQHRGRAPRERWNLFHGYFGFTYAREIERNSFASELLRDYKHHIEQIHARVGLLLQVEAERDGGASARLSRARLEEIIKAVLDDAGYEDNTERDTLIRDIVEAAKLRLVFLVEPEPGAFGFEIRSFQEFMCAWALTTGPEQQVESRVAVIARAPMFRNVTLFAASRLYGDGSHLSSMFARNICPGIDGNPDDPAASFTKAGAALALELLEEGAVLAYPKHARELMARASILFATPPSQDHLRLAHCANPEIRRILGGLIEDEFLKDLHDKKFDAVSVWICLIELINSGDTWATALADKYWAAWPGFSRVLIHFSYLKLSIGTWLKRKIVDNSVAAQPELFLDLRTAKRSDAADWFDLLCLAFDSNSRWRQRENLNGIGIRDFDQNFESAVASAGPMPKGWEVWCNAAVFELLPNIATLATALEQMKFDSRAAVNIEARASWPLASALRASPRPALRDELVTRLRSGELGSEVEWRKAELRWNKNLPKALSLDIGTANPWSVDSDFPPIEVIPWWNFFGSERLAKNSFRAVSDIYNRSESKGIREWAARVCLATFRAGKSERNVDFDVRGWVKLVPEFVGALLPRPSKMDREEWIEILRSAPRVTIHSFITDFDEYFEKSLPHDACPEAIDIYVRSISSAFGNTIGKNRNGLLAALSYLDANFLNSISGLVAQILSGTLTVEDEELLVNRLSELEPAVQQVYLAACVRALDAGRLSSHRSARILVSILKRFGKEGNDSFGIFNALRNVSQLHTTGLEIGAVWDRLGLFLPRPTERVRNVQFSQFSTEPIHLRSVELRNLAGIDRIKLDFQSGKTDFGQWTVIIGPNGVGKTSLLRALVLALRNSEDPTIWPNNSLSLPWVRRPCRENEQIAEASISVSLSSGANYRTRVRMAETTTFLRDVDNGPLSMPVFAYGCRRGSVFGGVTGKINLSEKDGADIGSLFDDGAGLIHAESWLIQLEGDAAKVPSSKVFYDAVIKALCDLLQVRHIFVRELTVWVANEGKATLPFSSLSDGYLVNAGWFIDVVARWSELAKKHNHSIASDFMSEMTGLVLIDEIDMHLHPQWQLEIIGRTRSLLPKMSFIVTTHNPLTLVGAKAEEIWVLDDSDSTNRVRQRGADPSILTGTQIYNDYFGISDFYPKIVGEKVHRYSFLSRFALRDDAEEDELRSLSAELTELAVLPSWPVVARIFRK